MNKKQKQIDGMLELLKKTYYTDMLQRYQYNKYNPALLIGLDEIGYTRYYGEEIRNTDTDDTVAIIAKVLGTYFRIDLY